MGKKSIVARANTTSKSLRITIPEEIVEKLQIVEGDALDWEVTNEKGRDFVKVRKLQ